VAKQLEELKVTDQASTSTIPSTKHTEEEKKSMIKSVASLDWKNKVTNLESKKSTWEDLGVPQNLIERGLFDMNYKKPSQIQAHSIPKIVQNPNQNFMF